MTSKELYRAIGNIDDDLIAEADVTVSKRKNHTVFIKSAAGIAACLCVVLAAVLFFGNKDSIHINIDVEYESAKIMIDDTAVCVPVSYEELIEYFGIADLPDTINDLHKIENDYYAVYKYPDGKAAYDRNIIVYRNSDSTKTVSVILLKENIDYRIRENQQDIISSKINGTEMIFSKLETAQGKHLWAKFEVKDVHFIIDTLSLNEEEFIEAVREIEDAVN